MYNLPLVVVMFCLSLLFFGCSDKVPDRAAPQNGKAPGKSMHSGSSSQAGTGESAVAEAIKKQTLPEFPTMPIGKALDGYSYFTEHEWKGMQTDAGKYYIDCIGWLDSKQMDVASLKNGVARQGVAVKFVVAQDSSYRLAMVSRLEAMTDGSVYSYPLEDAKAVLAKIYANKEIHF